MRAGRRVACLPFLVALLAVAAWPGAAAAKPASYRCVAAPRVALPPSPPTPLAAPTRPLCGAGRVPTPAGKREAKLVPEVAHPVRQRKDNPGYHYVSYYDYATAVGTYADITVAQPTLDARDRHTLGEVAAQSQDGRQIVEIGWTVDPGVNGGDQTQPHLFVYHWVNGVGRGYNCCGFVQQSSTIAPGMTLPVANPPTPHRFTIEQFDGKWWVRYDSEWVGYFPDAEWTAPAFTQIGLAQWFGEVADGLDGLQCTEMGDGISGSSPGAATIGASNSSGAFGTPFFIDASNHTFRSAPTLSVTPGSGYTGRATTGGWGGPGPCAASGPPPRTTIGAHPPRRIKVNHGRVRVTFSFASDQAGSAFECDRDGRAASPCRSPLSYRVGAGQHSFSVFAINPAGQSGPAKSWTFKVVHKRHAHGRAAQRSTA